VATTTGTTIGTETHWRSMWVEMAGAQVRLVKGKTTTTRVIEAGSGDPLILVHGIGGYAEAYARNIHNLAKHFHVYSIDARYHGYSSKDNFDPQNVTLRQAEAIVELLDAEGHKWAHIKGESMGSNIAFTFGLNFPNRAGKLVFDTGAYFIKFNRTFKEQPGGGDALMRLSREAVVNPTPENVRKRLEWLVSSPDRITDEMVDFRMKLYKDPEINASMQRVFGITVPRGNNQPYAEADCKRIKNPSMVFWTEHNPGAGPDVGEYFHSLIPGSEYFCLPDAAHWPMWEHPADHDRVITEFLKK